MNTFGHTFRITVFGESHGKAIGVTVDGVPAGISLSEDDFATDMARRRGGTGRGVTPRAETDRANTLSGVYRGFTTGAPVTILLENADTRSEDYYALKSTPRPSHADLTARTKYGGYNDPRGGGMFSGRMTAAIVAAGVIAKKTIPEVRLSAGLVSVGGSADKTKFAEIVSQAAAAGDSVGGIVEIRAEGVTVGWGEPFFDSVESMASHIAFSIPGVKGVEFGAGFCAANSSGSSNNDAITDASGTTATNHDGGINGGIANGNAIVMRVAFKPTPSISLPQQTVNLETGLTETIAIGGRHDACIALRGAVVAEAALAIALADLALRDRSRRTAHVANDMHDITGR